MAAVDQAYPGDEIAAAGPTGKGSLVVWPTGEVIAAAGADPQLFLTDIDLARRRKRGHHRGARNCPESLTW